MIHCIYHDGCPDGFSAAWTVRQAYGLKNEIEFWPTSWADPIMIYPNPGDLIIVADFAYPPETLHLWAEEGAIVRVFDHHMSSSKWFEGWEDTSQISVVFDMERSGAGITWDCLMSNYKRPKLIDYVEDRDLWRNALPGSLDISPLFMGTPMTWLNWDELRSSIENGDAAIAGRAMRTMREKIINDIVVTQEREMTIGDILTRVCASPHSFGSDVAGALAQESETAGNLGVAAYYVDKRSGRQFGLRSTENGPDVSVIAESYGGGGHVHAAGFEVEWGHELAPIYGFGTLYDGLGPDGPWEPQPA